MHAEQKILTIQLAVIEAFGSRASETHVEAVLAGLLETAELFEEAEDFISACRAEARALAAQLRPRLVQVLDRIESSEDSDSEVE